MIIMKTKYKDMVNGYELEFNSKEVFKSKIILSIIMKNERQTILRCLNSVFSQKAIDELGILLIDDSSNDNWTDSVQKHLQHSALVIYQCNIGKISSIRNLAISLTKKIFPDYEWLGRLDADDCLENPYSIADTLNPVLCQKSKANWILAGNSLCEDGIILERKNFSSTKLMTKEGLLSATLGMSRGVSEAELPSCNLWLHRDLNVTYPSVPSAEDHWLVAFLLAHYSSSGIIRSETLYSCYTLGGKATSNARQSKHYRYSRELLHNCVLYWFNEPFNRNEIEAVLGWGEEATVYRKGNRVQKCFIVTALTNGHVSWLKLHLKGPHFPVAEWERNDNFWTATYPFQNVLPLKNVSLHAVRKFIHYCLNHNIVCLDFARYNCGIVDGELFYFDIGRDVQPFKITYFRDMCARIYLLLILGYSDEKLKKHTKLFRDNEGKLKEIAGFESFYKDIMISWIESHEFGKKIKPIQSNHPKLYNDVTLLIKSCALDAPLIDVQINHILTQLCSTHEYAEIILLVDSRRHGFFREYNKGNYEKVVETGQKLLHDKKINKLLIAPTPEKSMLVKDLYCRWFEVQSEETHTEQGIPVFSQLWAFEQVATRYVLQLDIDVIVGHKNGEHDYLQDMLTAIQEKDVFCVGFNIPHSPVSRFTKYDAPTGEYKPEVRFGLLDLNRLKNQRPFPNIVKNGFLEMTWYQSVYKYQKAYGWKSLRGGNPDTYYIHPPNKYKTDEFFIAQVIDLVEQNQLPKIQYEKWDLLGNQKDWDYSPRNEEIVVLIMGKDTNITKISRCLDSLYRQSFRYWGAVIVDDTSTPELQRILRELVLPFSEKITLVQRKFRLGKALNEWDLLPKICHNPDSLIVVLDMDDCFTHEKVLDRVYREYRKGYEIIFGGMFRPDKALKRYQVRFDDIYKPDGSNVWIHLRSFRISLFKQLEKEDLMLEGNWIEHCDDFAIMVPLVKKSRKCTMIEEYLYFHERNTSNLDHIRRIKDKIIDHIIRKNRTKAIKRPTRYCPNLKKIEIDITYLCNLKCKGCDRSCTQAPEQLHMPVQTIRDFLSQTEKTIHQWESVHILGGEPTLHPNFIEIITLLDDWFQKHSPSTELKIISNGYSRKTREILSMIPKRWYYENSFKDSQNIPYFEPFNIAPIDLPKWRTEDFSKGCWISQYCGIGLTPQGYFPCAVAGGIERVMKLGKGEQTFPNNDKVLQDMYSDYCRFCGHFLQDHYLQREERETERYKFSEISKSWEKAYKSWNKQSKKP